MIKCKILIVDDDPIQLRVVSSLLKDMPYQIMMAHNGRKAIEITQKNTPDLIILDWQMPLMSGIDAIKEIRSFPAYNDVPIVITTGVMLSQDYLQQAFAAGASTYLRKPIAKLDLLACIHSMLSLTETNRKVSEKNDLLEKLAKEKDHMISVVAHDLKSPLNKLQGLLQLADMTGEFNHEQTGYVDRMIAIIKDGKELIRDLLDIYSFEHHGSRITFSQLNIIDLFEKSLQSFQKQIAEKTIKLEKEITHHELIVESDKDFLRRVIDNILSNAVKFSSYGGCITVKVSVPENAMVRFSVSDCGPGIADESAISIFKGNKLQQVGGSVAGDKSTGLGLVVIKTLVEKLGGTIDVSTGVGKGTTFVVELPIYKSEN